MIQPGLNHGEYAPESMIPAHFLTARQTPILGMKVISCCEMTFMPPGRLPGFSQEA